MGRKGEKRSVRILPIELLPQICTNWFEKEKKKKGISRW